MSRSSTLTRASTGAMGAATERLQWSDKVRQTAERRLEVGSDDTAAVLTDADYGRALDLLDAIEATTAAHAVAVRHAKNSMP